MKAVLLIGVLILSVPVAAQDRSGTWPSDQRSFANALSNIGVGAQVGIDLYHAAKQPHPWKAVGCEGAKLGAAVGVSELTKHFVHRERPNGVDNKSFFSEHTAIATAGSGWNLTLGIPLAAFTGSMRRASDFHWWSDIAVGAAVGGTIGALICR